MACRRPAGSLPGEQFLPVEQVDARGAPGGTNKPSLLGLQGLPLTATGRPGPPSGCPGGRPAPSRCYCPARRPRPATGENRRSDPHRDPRWVTSSRPEPSVPLGRATTIALARGLPRRAAPPPGQSLSPVQAVNAAQPTWPRMSQNDPAQSPASEGATAPPTEVSARPSKGFHPIRGRETGESCVKFRSIGQPRLTVCVGHRHPNTVLDTAADPPSWTPPTASASS